MTNSEPSLLVLSTFILLPRTIRILFPALHTTLLFTNLKINTFENTWVFLFYTQLSNFSPIDNPKFVTSNLNSRHRTGRAGETKVSKQPGVLKVEYPSADIHIL